MAYVHSALPHLENGKEFDNSGQLRWTVYFSGTYMMSILCISSLLFITMLTVESDGIILPWNMYLILFFYPNYFSYHNLVPNIDWESVKTKAKWCLQWVMKRVNNWKLQSVGDISPFSCLNVIALIHASASFCGLLVAFIHMYVKIKAITWV